MSRESNTILLNAIIDLQHSENQIYVTFDVTREYTISQLMEYIDLQLRSRYGYESTAIYYMFNEFQTTMNEEARLGGLLLPHDCMLEFSMIESGSTLYVEARPYVHQAGEELQPEPVEQNEVEEVERDEEKQEEPEENPQPANPFPQIQDSINNYISNINNQINQINQPIIDIDIDNQQRLLDIASVLDVFSRVSGISQPRPPVNPLVRLNDLLMLLQDPQLLSVPRNFQDVVVGLNPADLDKLKVGLYKDLTDSNKHKLDTCSICFEQFNDEDKCRELKCCHMFHQQCVDHWLTEHITCPVCREETGKGLPKL